MKIKVLKFGGSTLKNKEDLSMITKIISKDKDSKVLVVSALYGVTDLLQETFYSSTNTQKLIKDLHHIQEIHLNLIKEGIKIPYILLQTRELLQRKIASLYQLFLYQRRDLKSKDLILSFGERLSAIVLEGILRSQDLRVKRFEADEVGIFTDDLSLTQKNLKKNLIPYLKRGITLIITGFFGKNKRGEISTFGRGGSDYTAGIVAFGLNASEVQLYKDVPGFMSSDPQIIPKAKNIRYLSYDEAAELGWLGAKIFHPKTIEPIKDKNIPIIIKDIYLPSTVGTVITKSPPNNNTIKSISARERIGILKIYGSGIGYRPEILARISKSLFEIGISIKSVAISYSSINLLLEGSDMARSHQTLLRLNEDTVERIEKIQDIVLVGIVGEGISRVDVMSRVFSAISRAGISIELFSGGGSDVVRYLIVQEKEKNLALKVLHQEFFESLD
jgi:aspartate kinase